MLHYTPVKYFTASEAKPISGKQKTPADLARVRQTWNVTNRQDRERKKRAASGHGT
jgi:hypothetical protein